MKKRNSWTTRVSLLLALVSLAPVAAAAGDRQFDAIVRRIEAHYHHKPAHFMGFASFIANRTRPEGIKNLRFAVFEDLDPSLSPPGNDFAEFVKHVAEPEFHPFVRVLSRRDGEQTLVFARPVGEDFELLVVCLERDEATVVKMRLNPEAMSEWVDEPVDQARHSARGVDSNR
jgi:hypothetical protein